MLSALPKVTQLVVENFSQIGITITFDWYSCVCFLTSALGFLPHIQVVRSETKGSGAGIQDPELAAKLLCSLYFFFLSLGFLIHKIVIIIPY